MKLMALAAGCVARALVDAARGRYLSAAGWIVYGCICAKAAQEEKRDR